MVGPTVLIEDHDDNGVLSVHDEVASVAAWIGSRNDGLSLPDRRRFALDLLGNMRGTMTHVLYAQGHNGMISSTAPSHRVGGSRQEEGWPPNHDAVFSSSWKHSKAESQGWVALHTGTVSATWSGGSVHHVVRSRTWPAGHSLESSEAWDFEESVPHQSFLSAGWPPDHNRSISYGVDTHHNYDVSKYRDREGRPPYGTEPWPEEWLANAPGTHHTQRFSASWVHDLELSKAYYPAGHGANISIGWRDFRHLPGLSLLWPSNHQANVSLGWPFDGKYYPAWAPNHGAALSVKDRGEATPPPGWNGRRKPVEPKPLGELMGHANSQTSGDIDPTTPATPATAWAELFMTLDRDKSES